MKPEDLLRYKNQKIIIYIKDRYSPLRLQMAGHLMVDKTITNITFYEIDSNGELTTNICTFDSIEISKISNIELI